MSCLVHRMSNTVIKVENLGKKYLIRHQQGKRYTALRDVLTDKFISFGKRLISLQPHSFDLRPSREEFWALKDVSFDVKQGDRVGIIGRNGAGKTTLLKLLSRITEPTTGRIALKGRVASLLEVGTGFHPELTGRENIFLNGAILGMSKSEIKRKFDEIVDFAEIGRFLDTPVKRYSSGMYVRLAFAVAAHLEPEILLVDEVLAVGDASFQKKCLGRMEEVGKEGRTVLFVSHNMGAINQLCANAIWLDKGHIRMQGAAEAVVAGYLSMGSKERGECLWDDQQYLPGDEHTRLRAVRIRNSFNEVTSRLDIRLQFYVEIEYEVLRVVSNLRTGFRISTIDGTVVFTSSDINDNGWAGRPRPPGKYVSRCEIPGNLLNEGQYSLLNVWADIPYVKVIFGEEVLLSFHIEQTGGVSGRFSERWSGVICPALRWNIITIDNESC